jgi:arylsulfatase A-like enzyme
VDWFPTLVKLTGAPAEQKLAPDGLDIWPVLTQAAKSPHEALLLPGMAPDKMALRMGDWKLLLNPSDKDAEDVKSSETSSGKMELYNLASDIAEKNNLADSEPAKLAEMRHRHNTLIKDAVPAGGGTTGTITKKTKKGKAKKA